MSKEEYMMGMKQAPNYLMESQIMQQEVKTIRIAESFIEQPNTSFHGIWKHSSNEMVVIDTKTNFLFGMKCVDRANM